MNMMRVLWCRFQQCLGRFTTLLVEQSSQTRLFKHLSSHVFGVHNFGNKKGMKVISCFHTFKISDRFRKCNKNREQAFCSWDNCIWIGIVELSLLITGYFSSAGNVLTSSPRFWMSIRGTFFNSVSFAMTNEYDKGAAKHIATVLGHVYHIAFEASSETRLFRHLSGYLFRVWNFGNTKSMRVTFFSKISKI